VNKRQAQFIRDKFLDRFRSEYNVVDRNALPILEQVLFDSGIDFNEDIRLNLEKSASISTGALLDISSPQVTTTSTGYTLSIGYPLNSKQIEYYDFINKGVGGVGGKGAKLKKNSGKYKFKSRFPNRKMAAAIFTWLNKARKSVSADKVDLSKLQKKRRKLATVLSEANNKKKLAYNISSAIKRNGIAATYYFDRAIDKNFGKNFIDSLVVALEGDINIKILSNGNNNSN
jgi:hypothetical protein